MRRLVNATKSVNFQKYEVDFKKHKRFVKNLERLGEPRASVPPASKRPAKMMQTTNIFEVEDNLGLTMLRSSVALPTKPLK